MSERCVGRRDKPTCPNTALDGYRRCYYCEKINLLAEFQMAIVWGPIVTILAIGILAVLLDHFGWLA